jgi:hypothetical protein
MMREHNSAMSKYSWQRAGEDVLLVRDVTHATMCGQTVVLPPCQVSSGLEHCHPEASSACVHGVAASPHGHANASLDHDDVADTSHLTCMHAAAASASARSSHDKKTMGAAGGQNTAIEHTSHTTTTVAATTTTPPHRDIHDQNSPKCTGVMVMSNYRIALLSRTHWIHIPLALMLDITVEHINPHAHQKTERPRQNNNKKARELSALDTDGIVHRQTSQTILMHQDDHHKSGLSTERLLVKANRDDVHDADTHVIPAVKIVTRDYRDLYMCVHGGYKVCQGIVRFLKSYRFDSLRWLVDCARHMPEVQAVGACMCVCVCMYVCMYE